MKRSIIALMGFLILVFVDQYTKYLAALKLRGTDGISLISGVFRLYYLENSGAAFGILQNQRWILLAVTLIVCVIISVLFFRIPKGRRYLPIQISMVLICSGAIGNTIDRIWHGYVIDFFYFELIDFPIFNVADCYVVIAVTFLFLLFLFFYREDELELLIPFSKSSNGGKDERI